MISREFLAWLESDWIRTLTMVFISMIVAFLLVVGVVLGVQHSHLAEQQIRRLDEIEAEAVQARIEREKARRDAAKAVQQVKALENIIENK
jgi:ABC-type methionine transport system permease subunit